MLPILAFILKVDPKLVTRLRCPTFEAKKASKPLKAGICERVSTLDTRNLNTSAPNT